MFLLSMSNNTLDSANKEKAYLGPQVWTQVVLMRMRIGMVEIMLYSI